MEVMSNELTLTLNEVFKQLASGKLPRDDTLLEKVLTWLQEVLHDAASCERFLHSTGFTSCLSGVCFQQEIDFRVWAFLLRLSGHVASRLQGTRIEPEFLGTVQRVFSETVERDHLWAQASIRCSWLNGLEFLLRDHQFFSEAVVGRILQSLEDTSWFVSKASVSLISRILHNTSGEGSLRTKLLKHILSCLNLKDSAVASNRLRFTACMLILESVCSEAVCYSWLCSVVSHDDFFSQLCFAIESSAGEQINERCTAVLQVMSAMWQLNICKDKVSEKLSELTQKLLLSSHLSMAIEIAAWILERIPSIAQSSVMLETICLLPLWISVRSEVIENDLSVLSSCLVDDDCYKNLISMMNRNAARHSSLVKMSLTVIMQLKSNVIHQHLVFGLVKDILEQTTNESCPTRRQPLLQINCRLKHQCLDVLITVLTTLHEAAGNALLDVCPIIVNLLLQPDHDQVTISKAYELLLELLRIFGDQTNPQVEVLLAKLPTILQRTVNSLNWDIRDTAIGFIGKLMSLCTDSSNVISIWVEQNNIIQYISGSLKDSESYVRASALKTLGIMCRSVLFQSEKTKSEVQTHLWPEVMRLCQDDAETFSRRAAVELVVSFYADRLVPIEERTFENVMLHAINDSDWDIKLKVVAFWDAYANDLFFSRYGSSDGIMLNVSSDLSHLMKALIESGCLKALVTAAEDCDKSVQLHGLKALKNVKEQSARSLKLTLKGENNDCSTSVNQLSSNNFNEEPTNAGKQLTDILNCVKFDEIQTNDEKDGMSDATSVLRYLVSLDLDSLIVDAETSTDGHDGRPESLLNDLVMSLVMPVTYGGSGFTSSEEDNDDDDEMAVDCY